MCRVIVSVAAALILTFHSAYGEETDQIACKGKVVDAGGLPVRGASVAVCAYRVEDNPGDTRVQRIGQASTAEDGAFAVRIPRQLANGAFVVARAPGLAADWTPLDVPGEAVTLTLGKASSLAGTVVDDTGKVLAGAEVRADLTIRSPAECRFLPVVDELDWFVTRTDEQGRFKFDQMPVAAKARIEASAPGKVFLPDPSNSLSGYPAGKADIRVVMLPESVIEGVAVDKATGKPRADVAVTAMPAGYMWPTQKTRSAKDGTFRFGALWAGKWVVQSTSPSRGTAEWAAAPLRLDLAQAQSTKGLKLELSKGVLVTARIVDAKDGRPIEGARLQIDDSTTPRPHLAFSDREGVCRVRLLPGAYGPLYASGPDGDEYAGRSRDKDLVIEEGKDVRMEFKLERRPRLTGTVVDPSGKPVAGARVQIAPDGHETRTDDAGRFALAVAMYGQENRWWVLAMHERRNLVALQEFTDAAKPVEIKAFQGANVAGKVEGPQGKPLVAAWVSIMIWAPDGQRIAANHGGQTDDDGQYLIRALPPGRVQLHAMAWGYGNARIEVALAKAQAEPVAAQPMVLQEAGLSVSGVVVDEDGKPVRGIQVDFRSEDKGQPYQPPVRTDENGRFKFDRLVKGKITVEVHAHARRLIADDAEVEAGAADVRIVLRRAITTEPAPVPESSE